MDDGAKRGFATRRRALAALGLMVTVALLLVFLRPEYEAFHEGPTMGTTFQVKWVTRAGAGDVAAIRDSLDMCLVRVNGRMSTYDPESEISRFNRHSSMDWFPVSSATASVVADALTLAAESDGAFDPTVGPLVDVWGFGAAGRRESPPDSSEIAAVLPWVGWRQLSVRTAESASRSVPMSTPSPTSSEMPALRKSAPEVRVDLSAIAKGHGVDELAAVLERAGARRYFVEIGGEIRVAGGALGREEWAVALEVPKQGTRQVGQVLELDEGAIATSGTYRNFVEFGQMRFPHAIDPSTGNAVTHRTTQVTTWAESCRLADGRATALLVLGSEDGLALANSKGWSARFLETTEDGHNEQLSEAWSRRLGSR